MLLREQLEQLLAPGVESLGYELLLLEYEPRKRRGLLRLYIDHPDGVRLEDCEAVSRQVSAILDVEEPIDSEYSLEVSSPGIDRPLVKPVHFQKAMGSAVRVTTRDYHLGRRRFNGRLVAADETEVSIDVDGEIYQLPLNDIERARLEPEW